MASFTIREEGGSSSDEPVVNLGGCGNMLRERRFGNEDKQQLIPDPYATLREENDKDKDKQQLRISTATTAAASTTAHTRASLASMSNSSVESSFRSKGSMHSHHMHSMGLSRGSSRKIMVSNLPRHSRRNKKSNEVSWLRDTLSLTSSTHSNEHRCSDDEHLQDSYGEFGASNNSGMNSNSGRGIINGNSNRSGNSFRSSGSAGHHHRAASSPAFFESLEVPELFPKVAATLPAIQAGSVSSHSEVSSVGKDDPEPVLPTEECPLPGCEGCNTDLDINAAEKEEGEPIEAPIKWIIAPIPANEEEELPPPPPRDSPRSSPRGSPRTADRWGQDNVTRNESSEDTRRPPRHMSPPRRTETMRRGTSPHRRTETIPRGGSRGRANVDGPVDAGRRDGSGGRDMEGSGSRGATRGGSLYPTPPVSVAPSRSGREREERPAPPVRYRSDLARPDGYREEIPRPPPRDHHPYDRQEEGPYRHPSRNQSPPRYGGAPGASYPSRDRYPPRDRSPERYPPRDRSPDRRHPPRDWGPPPPQQQWRGGDEQSAYSRRPREEDPSVYNRRPREDPYARDYRRRGYEPDREDNRPGYNRRREDPHERDHRRRGYEPNPYYENPRASRDDRRPRPDEYHRQGHPEVFVRPRSNHPPADDPFHHDRSSSYPEEDLYHRDRGEGRNRGFPHRGHQRGDPAYDAYPGPPAFDDGYGGSRHPPSREDPYNNRSHSRKSREEEKTAKESAYRAPPTPAPRLDSKTSKGSDQDMMEEKLKSSGHGVGGGSGGVADKPISVEISPGVHVPLRRTQETMQAVAVDFYQSVSCLSCSMDVFCIADVSYVICPTCRVISPVTTGDFFEGREIKRHGLGLGFTCESLFKMQSEIVKDRSKFEKESPKEVAPESQYTYERRQRAPISTSHY